MTHLCIERRRSAAAARLIGLLAIGALVLAGCAPAEEAAPGAATGEGDADHDSAVGEPDGEPSVGGAVAVGLEAESAGWAPWEDAFAPPSHLVGRSFYDPLMDRDSDGMPQPYLAESMEPDDDFTAYTLTLREGVEFHDGEPLDADAVVANLERHLEPGAVTSGGMAPVESVSAEDELTVRIELDQPHVAFSDYLVGQIGYMVSPAAFDSASEQPVGTGPFVFESWQRDQELLVSRNEDYWRDGLPYLEEISFRPIPDEDTRLQSLFSGDLQVIQTLRQGQIAQARERADEFNLFEHIGNDAGGAIYNMQEPPVDDVRVRQAVAHALDQDELIEVLGGTGMTPPAHGVFNPDSPWYDPEMEDIWPGHDLERAQELIDEYVEDPDRSDGREPGEPVEFTFDIPPDPSLLEIAAAYQAQIGEIGIEMEIRNVDQATHVQEAIGTPPDFVGDYQVKAWRIGEESDPDWMVPYYAPGSPSNFPNIESDELMGLLLEARQTPELEERRELYHQVNALFAEEVPFTLSGHTASLLGTDPDLYGFDEYELPDGQDGVAHPESVGRWTHVWLDR